MTLIVALLILGAFGLEWLLRDMAIQLPASLTIPTYAAIAAGLAAIAGAIGSFWTPRNHLFIIAFGVYALLALAVAMVVEASGIITSPYLAMALLVVILSGVFGWWGLIIVGSIINAFLLVDILILQTYLTEITHIVQFILFYDLALIASGVIWRERTQRETDKDKAYNELARELSQVTNKAEIVINAIADGVIAVDGEGTIQLINPAAQEIIGWGKQDAVGLDFKSVFKLEDEKGEEPGQKRHPVKYTLQTNETKLDNDLTLITGSGKKLIVSVLTSPLGQPGTGAIIVFRDITQAKKEEREQAEFISTASHEMRTPVASIEGYLGLAMNPQTAAIDDKARLYLSKAKESAQHLGKLFQDLLDISRLEDGRLQEKPGVVDVVALSQDIVSSFEPIAQQKGISLVFKPVRQSEADRRISPVFYTYVDYNHLREVITNLVDNAIKYTQEGDVSIDVSGDSEHVTIKVSDTGIGIPAEDLPHLFQKFYRVDSSETREIGGTGLGLYLCRRLVENMQGRIWVESQHHQGSTFFVELPRMAHDEATRKLEESAEATPTPKQKTAQAPAQPTQQKPTPPPAAPQQQQQQNTPQPTQPQSTQQPQQAPPQPVQQQQPVPATPPQPTAPPQNTPPPQQQPKQPPQPAAPQPQPPQQTSPQQHPAQQQTTPPQQPQNPHPTRPRDHISIPPRR